MKLIVFGSTGSVGRHLVNQALEQGYWVTAFTRDAKKINTSDSHLKVVQGDILDQGAVARAVAGHDVVLCVIGAGMKGDVRAKGTRHIIQAMENSGVHRFICQSSLGVGESWGNLNLYWKYFMFGILLRKAFQDHVEQEKLVIDSKLNWTIVRPGAFTNGEKTGQYSHGFDGSDQSKALKISRADVADFLLKQIESDCYLCKTPALSY